VPLTQTVYSKVYWELRGEISSRNHKFGSQMALVIEPLGGLGNQLFVYGAGLALSRRLGIPVHVDNRNYRNYEWHKFELASFNSELTLIPNTTLARSLEAPPLFLEASSKFDDRFLDISAAVRLRGYFQSWKYIQPVRDQLIKQIKEIKDPSEWYIKTKKELAHAEDWTAVHVRMGNYVILPNIGVVSRSFLTRSTNLLQDLNGKSNLVLFSDDVSGAIDLLGPLAKDVIEVIDSPQGGAPVETLNLMSMAKHFIISNSTFSWWAAWIGSNENSRVLAPRPWLVGDRHDDRDILPNDWIALGRD